MAIAKEFCSCHFLVGQTVEHCTESMKQAMPYVSVDIDEKEKTVKTVSLQNYAVAQFQTSRYGCTISSAGKTGGN